MKRLFPKRLHQFIRNRIGNVIAVIIGTFVLAISYNLFFTPLDMVPGGFTGLSIIIRHITSKVGFAIPVWFGSAILNIPLLAIAGVIRGWRFAVKTILSSLLLSVWLFVIPEYSLCHGDFVLTAVFGGVLMGVGLGIVFASGTTTGGTDTLASLLNRFIPYIPTAVFTPILDGIIIGCSVLVFGLKISLYAVISVIVSGQVSDRIVRGLKNAYAAWIVSDKRSEIADSVINELGRGATAFQGVGMYEKCGRNILLCAVSKKQVFALKDIVYREDPGAFMIISDCHEIRGEGFISHDKIDV